MGRRYREKEERNELQAIVTLGCTAYNHILLFNGLEIAWASYENKRKGRGKDKTTNRVEVNVRGQDIFARNDENKQTTLWEKFLLHHHYRNGDLVSLANTDHLAEEYYDYLINFYPASDRYSNLDMNGHMWLRKVIRLAVTYHIMENKLAGHLRSRDDETDDKDYFCNDFAVYLYTLVKKSRLEKAEVASVITHIVKDEAQKKALLEEFFAGYDARLQQSIKPLQEMIILRLLPNDSQQTDDDTNEKGIMEA